MVSKVAIIGIIVGAIVVAAVASFLVPNPPPQTTIRTPPNTIACTGTTECIRGSISKIVDGDTLDIGGTRIRLALVNTPEAGEPGYDDAKDFTAEICPVGSTAVVDVDDGQPTDRFGRTVGKVWCGVKVLNDELIKARMGQILTEFCNVSEFKSEDWAKGHGC
jgi:micrococcal nuclease